MATLSETKDSLIRALCDPARHDSGVESVRLVETHISWVLLTGEHAYKVKKPVHFSFVDFSTLERRYISCEEELRLNRRLAPDIYLGVVPIGGTLENPLLGEHPAIEHAVKMREFPSDARLDERLRRGSVSVEDVRELAQTMAEFHASLPPSLSFGSPIAVSRTVLANVKQAAKVLEKSAVAGELAAFRRWVIRGCVKLEPVFARRKRAGAIRECHGDLHLENLVYWDGRIVPFDALEFDPGLRWIDVMDEVAFLVMDLIAHGEAGLACEFLNGYLEISGDYAGLDVLRFYLFHRALVRAKVAAIRQASSGASQRSRVARAAVDRYLASAKRFIAPETPLLLITHGLSASGKTSTTNALISRLPAIRLRADLERKRQHGLAPLAKSGSGIASGLYAPEVTRATYAALSNHAALALRAGFNVIVDATFLDRAERRRFAELADRERASFGIVSFAAPEAELRRRIEARAGAGRDASEATVEVLEHQLAVREPLEAEELAFVVPVDSSAAAVDLELLERRLRSLPPPRRERGSRPSGPASSP